jgi:phosphohistidine phosphatase
MELILWRHCEALPGAPDDLRELTPAGHQQAQRMARWLAAHLPMECRCLASPAVRARQTAAALGGPFVTVDGLAPGASATDILRIAGWPDGAATLIVGHQPTLSQTISRLLDGTAPVPPMAPGALVWLTTGGRRGSALLHRAVDADSLPA